MKKIEYNKLKEINGGSQKPNCFFVGLGFSSTGQSLQTIFGGLGYVAGLGYDMYSCWNS